jgi:hypothetical protein
MRIGREHQLFFGIDLREGSGVSGGAASQDDLSHLCGPGCNHSDPLAQIAVATTIDFSALEEVGSSATLSDSVTELSHLCGPSCSHDDPLAAIVLATEIDIAALGNVSEVTDTAFGSVSITNAERVNGDTPIVANVTPNSLLIQTADKQVVFTAASFPNEVSGAVAIARAIEKPGLGSPGPMADRLEVATPSSGTVSHSATNQILSVPTPQSIPATSISSTPFISATMKMNVSDPIQVVAHSTVAPNIAVTTTRTTLTTTQYLADPQAQARQVLNRVISPGALSSNIVARSAPVAPEPLQVERQPLRLNEEPVRASRPDLRPKQQSQTQQSQTQQSPAQRPTAREATPPQDSSNTNMGVQVARTVAPQRSNATAQSAGYYTPQRETPLVQSSRVSAPTTPQNFSRLPVGSARSPEVRPLSANRVSSPDSRSAVDQGTARVGLRGRDGVPLLSDRQSVRRESNLSGSLKTQQLGEGSLRRGASLEIGQRQPKSASTEQKILRSTEKNEANVRTGALKPAVVEGRKVNQNTSPLERATRWGGESGVDSRLSRKESAGLERQQTLRNRDTLRVDSAKPLRKDRDPTTAPKKEKNLQLSRKEESSRANKVDACRLEILERVQRIVAKVQPPGRRRVNEATILQLDLATRIMELLDGEEPLDTAEYRIGRRFRYPLRGRKLKGKGDAAEGEKKLKRKKKVKTESTIKAPKSMVSPASKLAAATAAPVKVTSGKDAGPSKSLDIFQAKTGDEDGTRPYEEEFAEWEPR